MSAQANIDLAQAATERIAAQGPRSMLDHYDEFFTEDFRWAPITAHTVEGGEYQGRKGFTRYLDDLEATFADLSIDVPHIDAAGDAAVVVQLHWRARGTESGIPLDMDVYWLLGFEGPKIASAKTFMIREDAVAAAESGAHA